MDISSVILQIDWNSAGNRRQKMVSREEKSQGIIISGLREKDIFRKHQETREKDLFRKHQEMREKDLFI